MKEFYIISIERSTLLEPFYSRPLTEGYTKDANQAGKYILEDIGKKNICADMILPVGAEKYLTRLTPGEPVS